ncbi:hypothetical protein ABZT34_33610 [Streptomyces sp. NPDC005329]|uniref:hypothetical protein n=1 Tax=Streptomyces sp. NPDC005329 TaxID=3157034 RepID=UPI0033A30ACF
MRGAPRHERRPAPAGGPAALVDVLPAAVARLAVPLGPAGLARRLDAEPDRHDGANGADDARYGVRHLGGGQRGRRVERGDDAPDEHAGPVAEHRQEARAAAARRLFDDEQGARPGEAATRVPAPGKVRREVGRRSW